MKIPVSTIKMSYISVSAALMMLLTLTGVRLIIIIIRAFVRRTMSASELNLRRRRLS